MLLLNYEFPPIGGGASAASYQISRKLVQGGHAVDVVTSRVKGHPAFERIDGIDVHRVLALRRGVQDCGLLGAGSYVASAAWSCRELLRRREYDVAHYFFGLPTGALSLLVPGLARLPSVLSLRGSDVPGYNDSDAMLLSLHRLLAPVTRRIWRRAQLVIANSHGLRELASQFAPELTIGVIPNAVATDQFGPLRLERRERRQGPLQVLCVARLVARKGVAELLHAVAQLPPGQVQLTVQGEGPERESLEALSCALGLQEWVRFAGFLPCSELPKVYAEADLFVLPSHSESCSMALLEAMASGLPVIATRVGGTPELIEDGVGGLLVRERDASSLARALGRLAADGELRERMGRHNRAQAEAHHSWDVAAKSYLRAYEHAIAGSSER